MDKVSARHLAADFYACRTDSAEELESSGLMERNGYHVLASESHDVDENHKVFVSILREGHFVLHLYRDISYVAADFFVCQNDAAPEKLLKELRAIFRPEKFRTTYLKRGDFSSAGTDMRPKMKTRLAPLRRIHNTGAKVIRMLAKKRGK